jgi:hypothetical protein
MASRYIKPRRRRRFTDKEQRFAVRRFTLAIISLDYSRDSGIETASIRVKGLLNWEND